MIHMPLSSRLKHRESPDTNSCIFSCSPKAAWVPVCVAHSHAKHSLLCSPCWPFLHCCGGGMCCSSACVCCFCCCRGHSDVFWPLPPKSQVFQRGAEEAELSSKSSPRLLELEGPKQGELAAVAARSPSSDSEVFPTQSTAVDSTVDTDPSCPEKPRLEESAGPSGNTPEGTTASLVPVIQELADAAAYVQRASWNPKPSLLWTCPVLHHLIRLQCLKPQSSLLEGNSQ